MQLIKKSYGYNDYKISNEIVTICKCLNPAIYVNTGYYIGLNSTVSFSEEEYKRGFNTLAGIKSYIKKSLHQRGL